MKKFPTLEALAAQTARAKATIKQITSNPLWENSESGLSLWAANSAIDERHTIERAAELGARYGVAFACERTVLVNSTSAIVADKRTTPQNYGWAPQWIIHDQYVRLLGRKWIPTGAKSRIQRKLGLREVRAVYESTGYDSACSGLGSPVSYFAVPARDAVSLGFLTEEG